MMFITKMVTLLTWMLIIMELKLEVLKRVVNLLPIQQ